MYSVERGKPIFGATVDDSGVNFAIFSKNGISVTLEIYDQFYDDKPFFSYKLDKKINKQGNGACYHHGHTDIFSEPCDYISYNRY